MWGDWSAQSRPVPCFGLGLSAQSRPVPTNPRLGSEKNGQNRFKIRSKWIAKCSYKEPLRGFCQVQGFLNKYEPISCKFESRRELFRAFAQDFSPQSHPVPASQTGLSPQSHTLGGDSSPQSPPVPALSRRTGASAQSSPAWCVAWSTSAHGLTLTYC